MARSPRPDLTRVWRIHIWLLAGAATLAIAACEPRIRIEAPREPITINLNIKLDADVRVQLQREAKEDVKTKDIF